MVQGCSAGGRVWSIYCWKDGVGDPEDRAAPGRERSAELGPAFQRPCQTRAPGAAVRSAFLEE